MDGQSHFKLFLFSSYFKSWLLHVDSLINIEKYVEISMHSKSVVVILLVLLQVSKCQIKYLISKVYSRALVIIDIIFHQKFIMNLCRMS